MNIFQFSFLGLIWACAAGDLGMRCLAGWRSQRLSCEQLIGADETNPSRGPLLNPKITVEPYCTVRTYGKNADVSLLTSLS
jgi:hypothetical protein